MYIKYEKHFYFFSISSTNNFSPPGTVTMATKNVLSRNSKQKKIRKKHFFFEFQVGEIKFCSGVAQTVALLFNLASALT